MQQKLTPEQRNKLIGLIEAHKKRVLPFPAQDAFVNDPSRFLAALCSRRAGKSNGLARRYIKTMSKYPGCHCPYIALTRDSAKNIMWDMLKEHTEKLKLKADFTEHNLTMTIQNGARLQLFGADMKNFIRRLRGGKAPAVGVDESQSFGVHISELVDDILTPMISDYPQDGWLALTGTPGRVPHGMFYDITEGNIGGYSVHRWTLLDNPYFPKPREFILDLKDKKKWTDDNPTLLREWCGRWVKDIDALVFKYDALNNNYASLPAYSNWQYVVGVDIGYDDADAIAVIGWSEKEKQAYLVEEFIETSQGVTELALKIKQLIDKYDPLSVVMDTGGLGKKIAEEIRRRFVIQVKAAEKERKFEFIELLNDAMRTKSFFAKSSSMFAQDAMRVEWELDTAIDKLKISDKFHSDICDATLYAFREALHWLSERDAIRPARGTPEWFKEEEKALEQFAQRTLKNKQSLDSDDFMSDESLQNDADWD